MRALSLISSTSTFEFGASNTLSHSCSFIQAVSMVLIDTKKTRLLHCIITICVYLYKTTFGRDATVQSLLLKEFQDLCSFRDSHLTRIFLDKYGFDGVIVCDNDKALWEAHPRMDSKVRGRKGCTEQSSEMYTFARGAPRAELASKISPSSETKNA